MPGASDSDGSDAPPRLSFWQRIAVTLPHLQRGDDKPRLGERVRSSIVKPVEPDSAAKAKASDKPPTVSELEASVKSADDKERLIGLIAAPVSAAIGLLVTDALVANDPTAKLKNGHVNPAHVNPSVYHSLTLVLVALSVVMLVTALLRKRLYLGIVMALFGLAIFNLRYWGFGIPFVLAGAWYIVRAYRLQRDLREATGEAPGRGAGRRNNAASGRRSGSSANSPSANKRYTPRTAPPKRRNAKPESA